MVSILGMGMQALKDNSTQVTSMVAAVPLTAGNWAGVGFSSNGRMVGSTALVARLNTTGVPTATVYDLKAQSPSGVVPGTGLSFVGSGSAETYYDTASQYVYMSYQLNLATSTPANPSFLVMAYGAQASDTTLQQHSNYLSVGAEFVTGTFLPSNWVVPFHSNGNVFLIFFHQECISRRIPMSIASNYLHTHCTNQSPSKVEGVASRYDENAFLFTRSACPRGFQCVMC